MTLLSALSLFVVLHIVYNQTSRFLYNKILAHGTAMADLPLLGKARRVKISDNAVVCGGSVAGIFAARVLADHFKDVLIIEPEEWVTTKEGLYHDPSKKRVRVSQYTFAHAFQLFLGIAIQKMFGNAFEEEMQKEGGRFFKGPYNIYFDGRVFSFKWWQNSPSQFFCTRGLLETTLRRLLLKTCKNVKYIHGSAIGLARKAPTGPVDGVQVKFENLNGKGVTIPAALVADCTGPTSAGFQWLKTLQADKAQALEHIKTTYTHNATYSFCEIDIPDHLLNEIKPLEISQYSEEPSDGTLGLNYWFPNPERERRVFVTVRQEKNILHIAAGGWGISLNDAPQSLTQLRDIAANLSLATPVPEWVFEMLELLEREDVPCKFSSRRLPPPTYIQYYLRKDLPSNFIALGDAIHHSNPMRGLGIGKASVDATTLNGILARCKGEVLPSDFGQRFFSDQANRSGGLWALSKVEDYSWDSTVPSEGESLSNGHFMRLYMKCFIRLATGDLNTYRLMLEVMGSVKPRLFLFTPSVIVRVFWMWVKIKLGLVRVDG